MGKTLLTSNFNFSIELELKATSNSCLSWQYQRVRAISCSLPRGHHLQDLPMGIKGGSNEHIVFRVKPATTQTATNSLFGHQVEHPYAPHQLRDARRRPRLSIISSLSFDTTELSSKMSWLDFRTWTNPTFTDYDKEGRILNTFATFIHLVEKTVSRLLQPVILQALNHQELPTLMNCI